MLESPHEGTSGPCAVDRIMSNGTSDRLIHRKAEASGDQRVPRDCVALRAPEQGTGPDCARRVPAGLPAFTLRARGSAPRLAHPTKETINDTVKNSRN
jgi:hypothetical protein